MHLSSRVVAIRHWPPQKRTSDFESFHISHISVAAFFCRDEGRMQQDILQTVSHLLLITRITSMSASQVFGSRFFWCPCCQDVVWKLI